MIALEHAPELRFTGTLPIVIAESQRQQYAWGNLLEGETRPETVAEAVPTAAIGTSLLIAVVAGIAITPNFLPNHTGRSDVVAALGILIDDSITCCRRPVDTVANSGVSPPRPSSVKLPLACVIYDNDTANYLN